MYRMLIVDDESISVDGLYDLFSDVQDLELDIYKAYSGIEAIEIMHKVKIDIILSDICMPNMNGLEVQRRISELWPRCRIIFLTGFNDFDYVQTAMRNSAADYILKTEQDEVIIRAVRKAVAKIEAEIKNDELVEKAITNMNMALPVLQKKYLMDLLEGMSFWDEVEGKKHFKELNISLNPEAPVLLMTARVDKWDADKSMTEKMKIIYSIQGIAEQYLNEAARMIPVVFERTKVLWILQPKTEGEDIEVCDRNSEVWNRHKLFVQGMIESVQSKCKTLLEVSTSFVVSGAPILWSNLADGFFSVKLTLDKTAGLESETLLVDYSAAEKEFKDNEERIKESDEGDLRYKLKKAEMLEVYLEGGQKREFLELLSFMMDSIKIRRSLSNEFSNEIYYTFAMVFLAHINKWNLIESLGESFKVSSLLSFNTKASWEEVHSYFTELTERIFKCKKEDHTKHNDKIISFIKEYTEEHLSGDLTVAKFAELLHFNPSYLSRMYKQCTGESISEFISEVKLTKAQKLLKQSNQKINEISVSLGFETPSYFTRFFKKKTNLTPQEYRDLAN